MYPFFLIFFIFCVYVKLSLSKSSHNAEKNKTNLLELEREANSTRRKSIDNLDYIIFSEKSIPINEINDNELKKIQEKLLNFADKKILNLSGISNIELKKTYGPANLPTLTEYDNNFLELVRTLHEYAVALNNLNFQDDAIKVLEYSVDIETDMGSSYKLLGDLYYSKNDISSIKNLLEKTDKVNNLSRNSVISYLQVYTD